MPRYIDVDEALLELDKELVSDEFNYAVRAISRVKTADVVERKKGKWIITDTYNNQIWHCNCSECGEDPLHFISGSEDWWLNKLPKFCPYCGADMREEKTNDD